MRAHHDLTKIGIATRAATTLISVVWSTAARSKTHSSAPWPSTETLKKVLANKLAATERHSVLTLLNCDRFVDQAPLEVYAELLDEGTYLCSVSATYRVHRHNTSYADVGIGAGTSPSSPAQSRAPISTPT